MQQDIIILIILVILSAFFSGVETALVSMSMLRVRILVKQRVKGAKFLQKIKTKPKRMLGTILLANNLANIAAASVATVIFIKQFGNAGVGIATGVMTFVILIFGEITPKNFSIAHAEKISLIIAPVMSVLMFIFTPLVLIFETISTGFIKILGGEKNRPMLTEGEFKTLVEIGLEENVLEKNEKEFIENVLEFNDITAKEIMTPRVDVFSLDRNLTVDKALNEINEKQFSRIPIYNGTIDKIVGVIYVKDLLKFVDKKKINTVIKQISEKPFFVPEKILLDDLFREFQKRRVHIAVVVDEFGGTAGIITLEDLLEELVGEIIDESDITPKTIKRVDKCTILVDGNTPVRDINEFFHTNLPEDTEHITIAGFIMHTLNKLPKKGTKLNSKGVNMIVEQVSDKSIHLVKLCKEE